MSGKPNTVFIFQCQWRQIWHCASTSTAPEDI